MAGGIGSSAGLGDTIGINAVQQLATIANNIASAFGTFVAVPANSGATGVPGQCAYDSGAFYICVATNSWIKFTGSTF